MAKSQLEIVLVDAGSEIPAEASAPTTEAVQSSSAGVPVRQYSSAAVPTRETESTDKPSAKERPNHEPQSASGRPERRDTTAVDVAGRVAEMTARAFGLGGLVSEIRNWQQMLHQISGLFKGAATSEFSPGTVSVRRTVEEAAGQASARRQQAGESEPMPQRQAAEQKPDSRDDTGADVKHFMRVTAPKSFNDFTSRAVDTLRAVMDTTDSGDEPPSLAVPSRPQQTAARDDRQQPPIKVSVTQPPGSQPLGRKVQPPRISTWTPPARPVTPSGIPLPSATAARAASPTAPPVIPSANVPRLPVSPVALPPTTAPSSGIPLPPVTAIASAARVAPGLAGLSSAAVPAAEAAVASTAVPAIAGGSTATAVAAGAAGAGASTAVPALGGVAAVTAALGPLGIAAIAVTGGLAALAVGVKKMSAYLHEEAQKLAPYSADVSSAMAENEVRQERAMMNRGARIGPQMAQFERSRGKNDERMADMMTSIQGIMLEFMNGIQPAVDKILSVAEAGVAGLESASVHAGVIVDILTFWDGIDVVGGMDRIAKANEKFGKEMLEILNGESEKNDPLNDEFNEAFMGLGAGMAGKLYGPGSGRRRAPSLPVRDALGDFARGK